jgi:transposase InsO family protein
MTARERSQRVEQIAGECDLHPASVYRIVKRLRMHGCRTIERKSCKGMPRITDEDRLKEYVQIVMGFKSCDPSKPNRRVPNPNKTMSTERALEIAERLGAVPEGLLTVRTLNRWAKTWGLTVKDICRARPAVKLVSEHPNQVHVVDFSVCEQYYLRESDGRVMERAFTYKNKPNESKEKIWAFALVDHYSGVKYIRYFIGAGESTDMLYRGLIEAWSAKDDSRFPFHGAPKMVYTDKGAPMESGKIKNLLAALGIELVKHQAGNPRAKGIVENGFRQLQTQFETELRLCPAGSIDELNERAYNWLVDHNWKAKDGEDRPRMQIWQSIRTEQLLELPSAHILRHVAASDIIRTVDVYSTIRLENKLYGVPPELVKKQVRVWRNIDGGLAVQDIATGIMYPTVDRRVAKFGEYNAHRRTDSERMQDEALHVVESLRKEITPEMLMRGDPGMHGLPRTGTPIEVDSELVAEASDSYPTVHQAKLAIADEVGMNLSELPGWMIGEIDAALKETLDKERVKEIGKYVAGYLRETGVAV